MALLSLLCLLLRGGVLWADPAGPNLIPGDFETGTPSFNPWAGVDDSGFLHVWNGGQLAVDDGGRVHSQQFSPSVAVADLNGDGLPDLVVADARGFFWYYANSGKPGAPVFTTGEVMPVWMGNASRQRGNSGVVGDYVPRIQVIDFAGENKPGLVVGNYAGELYYLHNRGTATTPDFRMPSDRMTLAVATHTEGTLWCNYLAPFVYDWGGTGRLDLTMGDGTYSANSMYLYTNQGTNGHPVFNEKQKLKIIPGMGREHLTPQVVDWNNDGKPDIIAGERAGYVDVYLNQNTDNSFPPTFDKDHPTHVMFGSTDKFGQFLTVCPVDLNGDKLFDLVLGNSDDRIYYCLNTGTPGNPKFGTPIPFKGVYPYAKIVLPLAWEIFRDSPYGAPYGLLQCVNAQTEPGFVPPPADADFNGHGAMKFSLVVPQPKYFKDQFTPDEVEPPYYNYRTIQYINRITLEADTRYTLSFWVRTEGNVNNLSWFITGKEGQHSVYIEGSPISAGSSWNRVTSTIELDHFEDSKEKVSRTAQPAPYENCHIRLNWDGDGTLYFDGMSLKKNQ